MVTHAHSDVLLAQLAGEGGLQRQARQLLVDGQAEVVEDEGALAQEQGGLLVRLPDQVLGLTAG